MLDLPTNMMLELPTTLIASTLKASDFSVPIVLVLAAVYATMAQLEINLGSGTEEPVAVVEEEVVTESVSVVEVEEEVVAEVEEEAAAEPEEKGKTFRKVRSVAKALYAPWLGMVFKNVK
jgi:hypothetical protein